MLAEVGFSKLRLHNVVVASAHPKEAPVECHLGRKPLRNLRCDRTHHWELLPDLRLILRIQKRMLSQKQGYCLSKACLTRSSKT